MLSSIQTSYKVELAESNNRSLPLGDTSYLFQYMVQMPLLPPQPTN